MIKVFDRVLVLLANLMASVEEARTRTIKKGIAICEKALLDLRVQEDKLLAKIARLKAQLK